MNYKNEIIDMIGKVKDENTLEYLCEFIKLILEQQEV